MTVLGVHAAGWVSLPFSAPSGEYVEVWAKTARGEDGRRVITALVIQGDRVSSAVTSRFPTGWLEERIEAAASTIAGAEYWADPLPGLALGLGEPLVSLAPLQREPLTRPDGQDPEAFYAAVADAYRSALDEGVPIAPTLAVEAGVPVGTARRWISESRRRGFLSPGRRGRAVW